MKCEQSKDKRKIATLVAIMLGVAIGGSIVAISQLYSIAVDQQEKRLSESAFSLGNIIHMMAQGHPQHDDISLQSAIIKMHMQNLKSPHPGFLGHCGVAMRNGGFIQYVVKGEMAGRMIQIPLGSIYETAMRRALAGQTGIMRIQTKKGRTLLAA